MTRTPRTLRLALLAALCWAAPPPALQAANIAVSVISNQFSPSQVTIQVGDTVTWTNVSGHHNVVANDGSFTSGQPRSGWVFSHTFTAPGTYNYVCQPHAIMGMRGQVIVKAEPAAPTGLRAETLSTSEIRLTWTDNATAETGFRIERRSLDGSFESLGSAGPNATSFLVTGLPPGTFHLFRVRAERSGVFSPFSNVTFGATRAVPSPCVAGPATLCLNGGRFKAEVAWRTSGDTGLGTAVPVPSAPDSGLFYFFNSANLEMLIKVLDACVFERYWVFYAATTNVEFAVLVTDTTTGQVKPYYNPLNSAAPPVQDTDAFASCP